MRIWRSYDLSYLAPNVIFWIFVIFLSYFAKFQNFCHILQSFRIFPQKMRNSKFFGFFCKLFDYIFTKMEASRLTLCETFEIMENAHKKIGEIPVSTIETDYCPLWSLIKPIWGSKISYNYGPHKISPWQFLDELLMLGDLSRNCHSEILCKCNCKSRCRFP